MEKTVADNETQTSITVSPHILGNNEVANVYGEMCNQTSITCLPSDSTERIIPKLKANLTHRVESEEVLTDKSVTESEEARDGPKSRSNCQYVKQVLNKVATKLRTQASAIKFTPKLYPSETKFEDRILDIFNYTMSTLHTEMANLMEVYVDESAIHECISSEAVQPDICDENRVHVSGKTEEIEEKRSQSIGDNVYNKITPLIPCECCPSVQGAAVPHLTTLSASNIRDSNGINLQNMTKFQFEREKGINDYEYINKINEQVIRHPTKTVVFDVPDLRDQTIPLSLVYGKEITKKEKDVEESLSPEVQEVESNVEKSLTSEGTRESLPIELMKESLPQTYQIQDASNIENIYNVAIQKQSGIKIRGYPVTKPLQKKSQYTSCDDNHTCSVHSRNQTFHLLHNKPLQSTKRNFKEYDSSETSLCKSTEIENPVRLMYKLRPSYDEPYMEELLNDTDVSIAVQTDLTLGDRLQSESLSSLYANEDDMDYKKCSSKTEMPWQKINIPKPGTYDIKRCKIAPEYVASVTKIEDETHEQPVTTEIEDTTEEILERPVDTEAVEETPKQLVITKPEKAVEAVPKRKRIRKAPLIYEYNPLNYNEPYMEGLYRTYPHPDDQKFKECGSEPEIPWKDIILPTHCKIRKIPKNKQYTCTIQLDKATGEENIKKTSSKCTSVYEHAESTLPDVTNTASPHETKSCMQNDASRLSFNADVKNSSSMPTVSIKKNSKVNLTIKHSNEIEQEIVKEQILNPSQTKMKIEVPDKPINNKFSIANSKKQTTKNDKRYKPCSYSSKLDPVVAALEAYEAEMKPLRQTLTQLQQKIRNLNLLPTGKFETFDVQSSKPNLGNVQNCQNSTRSNGAAFNNNDASTYFEDQNIFALRLQHTSPFQRPATFPLSSTESNFWTPQNTFYEVKRNYPYIGSLTKKLSMRSTAFPVIHDYSSSSIFRHQYVHNAQLKRKMFTTNNQIQNMASYSSHRDTADYDTQIITEDDSIYSTQQMNKYTSKSYKKNASVPLKTVIQHKRISDPIPSCEISNYHYFRAGQALKTDPDEFLIDCL